MKSAPDLLSTGRNLPIEMGKYHVIPWPALFILTGCLTLWLLYSILKWCIRWHDILISVMTFWNPHKSFLTFIIETEILCHNPSITQNRIYQEIMPDFLIIYWITFKLLFSKDILKEISPCHCKNCSKSHTLKQKELPDKMSLYNAQLLRNCNEHLSDCFR